MNLRMEKSYSYIGSPVIIRSKIYPFSGVETTIILPGDFLFLVLVYSILGKKPRIHEWIQ